MEIIERLLPTTPGLVAKQVHDSWGDQEVPRPSDRSIRKLLEQGMDECRWRRVGRGTSGKPRRYYRPEKSCRASSPSIGARHDPRNQPSEPKGDGDWPKDDCRVRPVTKMMDPANRMKAIARNETGDSR